MFIIFILTSEEKLSLTGYVITFNNTTDVNWNVTEITIGNDNEVILNNDNVVDINDSNKIENYSYISTSSGGGLKIDSNTNKTYILPIESSADLYLYNTYLLIEINMEKYYISNFNYINSNDFNRLENYIESGIIYEF